MVSSATHRAPELPAIVIECLKGSAMIRGDAATTPTTMVRGVALHRSGNSLWLRGSGWDESVAVWGPRDGAEATLATVQPTGGSC
jgi:hypothetical protein